MAKPLSDMDVYTLIGYANRRVCDKDHAMYFMELAEKIAEQIGDRGLARRCVELQKDYSYE